MRHNTFQAWKRDHGCDCVNERDIGSKCKKEGKALLRVPTLPKLSIGSVKGDV